MAGGEADRDVGVSPGVGFSGRGFDQAAKSSGIVLVHRDVREEGVGEGLAGRRQAGSVEERW